MPEERDHATPEGASAEGATAEGARRGLWAEIRASMRGEARDYTQGSIPRAALLLAVPMVLEMIMESVFGLVDVFFVARLGPDAVAAVGITESMLTIVFAIAVGLGAGTTAMVARRIGEKRPEEAAQAAVQAIILGTLASAVTGIAGVVFARRLLALMGATEAVVQEGSIYTTIIFGTSFVIYQLFLINAVFRGAGDASLAMKSLWLANGINIVLDPCLIFGLGPFPEMGLAGAAIATSIGRGAGVLYQLWALYKGDGRIRILRAYLRVEPALMGRLMKVSRTGILQYLITTSSWVALVRILALFGSSVLAGYTIAIRLVVLALLPSWGMCNAAATLVGQNLGAGKPERAERSVKLTAVLNAVLLGLVGLAYIVFAESLLRFFSTDPEVIAHGVSCLRWTSSGYVFYAFGMVYSQAFNGAGDTVTPTYINLFSYWALQIPLAYVLALVLDFGPQGVFAAIVLAEIVVAVVAFVLFRRGRWRNQEI